MIDHTQRRFQYRITAPLFQHHRGTIDVIDLELDENFAKSVRNIPGVQAVRASRLTARDVMDAGRVVATGRAIEKLQEALA